ncbi:MAG: MATE family efflux transporter [Methanosarcinaceae archaeon]|nr:MATE family efflux transporter [Methanosarcinaceae archaeon]
MHRKSDFLGEESVKKLLLKLSAPAIAGLLVHALYNVVDTFFVGIAYGDLAVQAIGGLTIAFPIQLLIMSVTITIGTGGASIISRALGAKDIHRAKKALGNVFFLSLIIGVLSLLFCFFDLEPALKLFGATPGIMPYANDYIQIIIAGAIFTIFSLSFQNIIRAEGNARFAMNVMLLGAGINILLDPIFIFGLGMGVRGAAIATVISQALSAVLVLDYFTKGKSSVPLNYGMLRLDNKILKEIASIGIGPFILQASSSFSMLLVNVVLALYGGDVAIAVYGLIIRLFSFVFMPILGVSFGLQPVVGYNYGAAKFGRVIESVKLSIVATTAIGLAGSMVMYLFPEKLLSVFSSDQDLLNVGVSAIHIFVLGIPLIGVNVIGATIFQALGRAQQSFVLSIARTILFLIPLLLILPRFYSLNGIWAAFPISDFLAFSVSSLLLLMENKKLRSYPNT